MIMVTHEPASARHAGRVVVLKDGRVSGEFSPEAFEDSGALASHYHAMAR